VAAWILEVVRAGGQGLLATQRTADGFKQLYKSFCQARAHVAPPMWRPVMLMMGRHRLLAGVRPKAKSHDGWDWGPLLLDALPAGAIEAAADGGGGKVSVVETSEAVACARANALAASTMHAACDACTDQTDSLAICAEDAVTNAAAGLSLPRNVLPCAECRGLREPPAGCASVAAETGPTTEALAASGDQPAGSERGRGEGLAALGCGCGGGM
jgi:hypothetical protein